MPESEESLYSEITDEKSLMDMVLTPRGTNLKKEKASKVNYFTKADQRYFSVSSSFKAYDENAVPDEVEESSKLSTSELCESEVGAGQDISKPYYRIN